jgi:hypothetical protein
MAVAPMPEFAIHRRSITISEAGPVLSRLRNTGIADGSQTRVPDKVGPARQTRRQEIHEVQEMDE